MTATAFDHGTRRTASGATGGGNDANPEEYSRANDFGHLLQLLQEVRPDGDVVQYFVCEDCMELVESHAGSMDVHHCSGKAIYLTAEGLVSDRPQEGSGQ